MKMSISKEKGVDKETEGIEAKRKRRQRGDLRER